MIDAILPSDTRAQLTLFTLCAFAMALPALGLADAACRVLRLPRLLFFATVLLVLGVAAEAVFFLTMVNAFGARIFVWIAFLLGVVQSVRSLAFRGRAKWLRHPDYWMPFAVTAVCAALYIAIFLLAMPPTANPITEAMSLFSLPDDNVLPHILAEHIAMHAPPKPFIAEWLSSDRPPLQAGFDLLFADIAPSNIGNDARYQALAVLLQATSFGALFSISRLSGCDTNRSIVIVTLGWLSGFFFLNSLFVWPKLIAATYVAIAVCFVLVPGRTTWQRAIGIGTSLALGQLSHGAIMFSYPPLIIAWLYAERKHALQLIPLVLATLVLLNLPWTWYQHVYDPPGDRLLKWQFAGQIPVSSEPLLNTLIRAYTIVPPSTLLQYRIDNLATAAGMPTTVFRTVGPKDQQFFSVFYALGALLGPYVAALFFIRSRSRHLRYAARWAWIALGGIVFWCATIYLPSTTSVHVGSYFTVLLMFAAGGIVCVESPLVCVMALGAQAWIFSSIWLLPIKSRSLDIVTGLLFLLGLAVAIIFLRQQSLRSSVAQIRHQLPSRHARIDSMIGSVHYFSALFTVTVATLLFELATTHVVLTVPPEPMLTGLAAPFEAPVALPLDRCVDFAHMSTSQKNLVATFPTLRRLSGNPTLIIDQVLVGESCSRMHEVSPTGSIKVSKKDIVELEGWAISPAKHGGISGLGLLVGNRFAPGDYGVPRPDVALVLHRPEASNSGYRTTFVASDLHQGDNPLIGIVVSSDKRSYFRAILPIILQLQHE